MTWEAIGASAEVLGVVAILVSLIYVAIQLRQSNIFAQADAEREVLQYWMHGLDSLVDDELTTKTLLRGLDDFDSLSSIEKTRLSYKLIELNVAQESMKSMAAKGLIPAAWAESAENVVFSYVMTPGGRKWWEMNGPFQLNWDEINARIETEGDTFPSFLESLPYHVIEDELKRS